MKISNKQAIELIFKNRGKYFTVAFQKRRNRKMRILTGRLGVKKGVIGIGSSYDPDDKGLIVVSETVQYRCLENGQIMTGGTQFRSIPIEGIRSINIGGRKYEVVS